MGAMTYVCVDVEASGQVPPIYNLLSIGAVIVRRQGSHHVLGDSFYCELRPVFPGFDPQALAVCNLDVERLTREGEPPPEALARFNAWVERQNAGVRERPVFVGHNAVFDWAYLSFYYAHFGLVNPFGYKGLDTKSLAMGRLGIAWNDTNKETLERMLRLPPQDPAQTHRADYDAWYQALILKGLLDLPAPPRPA